MRGEGRQGGGISGEGGGSGEGSQVRGEGSQVRGREWGGREGAGRRDLR